MASNCVLLFLQGPTRGPSQPKKSCTFLANRENCSGVGVVASAQRQLCALLHLVRRLHVRSVSRNLRDWFR